MKTGIIILLGLLSFNNSMIAQNEFVRSCSFSTGLRYNISTGHSFLTKGYENRPGFEIETQFNYRKFLVGLNFQNTNDKVSDANLVGNFSASHGFSYQYFVGYRQSVIHDKIYFEHRVGLGYKEIRHSSFIDDFKITGTVFSIGTRLNYKLNEYFNAYTGLDFNYAQYDIDIDGPHHDFFTKSYQISPMLGIKFLFATAKK